MEGCCFSLFKKSKDVVQKRYILVLVILTVLLFYSCNTTRCVLCEEESGTLYHVELNEYSQSLGKSHFKTFFPPVEIERSNNRKEIYIIDCDNQEPSTLSEDETERFIKDNVKVFKPDAIKRIVTTSDTDVAPIEYSPKEPEGDLACNRFRNAVKFETRGMLGFRPWWLTEPSITYPGYNGDVVYNRKFTSLSSIGEPNGSIVMPGLEAAMLFRFIKIENRHSLNVGPMLGLWPVDGGLYMPLSVHPRLTFNDITAPLWRDCNAWYIFGDIGTAYDLLQNIPFTHESELTSNFWGFGFGFDLWKKKGMDFSFDIGYRFTNLALPHNQDYIDCLEENGMNTNIKNPVRGADQIFIRVGYTW